MIKGASITLVSLMLGAYIGHLATMKYVELKLETFIKSQPQKVVKTHSSKAAK